MQTAEIPGDGLAVKGLAIYNDKLKSILEPEHNNEYVVIHVDNGDYAVSKRRWEATQSLTAKYGIDGQIVSLRIGTEPEYGLAARVFGGGAKPR